MITVHTQEAFDEALREHGTDTSVVIFVDSDGAA